MKLIQWNCQGSFRTKNNRVLQFDPDILVVAECENPERLKFGKLTPEPKSYYWYGDSEHKGIGIFCYSDYKIELLKVFNPEYRYVLPLKVTRRNESFTLFAVWAMNNKENRDARYIGQVWRAINHYEYLLQGNTVLLGDFNSNKIWDYKGRVGNHTDVVNKLLEKEIISLYHDQNSIEHGSEAEPTFFMARKVNKPYHIDYCFASKGLLKNGYNFTVGQFYDWNDISDHTPIIIEIK